MTSNQQYILRLRSYKVFSQYKYLIPLMVELGYASWPEGICHGFSTMGIQACLSGDLETFQQRIELLLTEKDRLLAAARTLVLKLKSNKPITQFDLTDNEKKVMELRNFFENLEVIVNPQYYEAMLGKKISMSVPYEALPFVASNAIEDAGGMVAMEGWPGLYKTNEEYTNYVDALQHSVMQAGIDIGFSLHGPHHVISIVYDAKKSQWMMIDSDNLYRLFNPIEHGTLSRLIMTAFHDGKDVGAIAGEEQSYSLIMATIPFSTGNNLEKAHQWFNNFKNHPAFIAAHTITDKKATIVTERGNTLAHVAAELGHTKILDEIKAHGGDIEKHIFFGRTATSIIDEVKHNDSNQDVITEDVFMHYLTQEWDEDDDLKLENFFRKLEKEYIVIAIEFLKIGSLTKYIKDTEDLKVLAFINDAQKNVLINNFGGVTCLVSLVKNENDVYIIRDLIPESKRTEFFNALDSANISYTRDKLQNNQTILENIAAGINQELIKDTSVFRKLSEYSFFKLKSFIDNVDAATLHRIFYYRELLENTIATLPIFLMKDLINKIDAQTMQQLYSRASDLENFLKHIPEDLHYAFLEKMNAEKLAKYIRDSFFIARCYQKVISSITAEKMSALMNNFIKKEFLNSIKTLDQLQQILSVMPDADKITLLDRLSFERLLILTNQSTEFASLFRDVPESAREFLIINVEKRLLADFMLNCMLYSFEHVSVPLRELLFERFTDEEILSIAKTTSQLDNILENLPSARVDKFLGQLHESIQNKRIFDDREFKAILEERQHDKSDVEIEKIKPAVSTTVKPKIADDNKSSKSYVDAKISEVFILQMNEALTLYTQAVPESGFKSIFKRPHKAKGSEYFENFVKIMSRSDLSHDERILNYLINSSGSMKPHSLKALFIQQINETLFKPNGIHLSNNTIKDLNRNLEQVRDCVKQYQNLIFNKAKAKELNIDDLGDNVKQQKTSSIDSRGSKM